MSKARTYAALLSAGLAVLGVVSLTLALHSLRGRTGVVAEVAPGVHQVHNFLSDVYATRAGKDVLLFDAGMDPEGHAVDDLLIALGATREQVTHVFLSHAHFDHIAAAGLFPNARVHLGAADVAMAAHDEPARPLLPRLFGALIGSVAVQAQDPLQGLQRIDVGGSAPVLALPFPGHTPGSYLYLYRGVLFTGDSINLDHGQLVPAVPDHSVDPLVNRTSISRLPFFLGYQRVDYVCTGHMRCSSPGSGQALLQQLLSKFAR
jgi:hydroxyacylglutathione hydrolase